MQERQHTIRISFHDMSCSGPDFLPNPVVSLFIGYTIPGSVPAPASSAATDMVVTNVEYRLRDSCREPITISNGRLPVAKLLSAWLNHTDHLSKR